MGEKILRSTTLNSDFLCGNQSENTLIIPRFRDSSGQKSRRCTAHYFPAMLAKQE